MKISILDDYFDTLRTHVTHDEYEVQFTDVFDQIVAYAAGSPIHVVNPEAAKHLRSPPRGF